MAITWTEQEWHQFAKELLIIRPHFLTLERLPLAASDLRQAMMVLSALRHRPVIEIGGKNGYHKKLLLIYAIFRGAPDALPVALAPETQALAIQNEFGRVRWRVDEWVCIAQELLRIRPHERLLHSTMLAGLHAADVREAQKVLSPARRRPIVFNPAMRAKLLQAFATLRISAEQPAAPCVEVDIAPVIAPPPEPVLPLKDIINPYEAVFAPLLTLLAERVADVLLPRLVALLQQPVAPGEASVASPGAGLASALTSATGLLAPAVNRPRRMKIGIAGVLPIQAQDIAAAFPQFEVIYQTEGSHGIIEKMRGVDRMIGMVGKMGHQTENKLKPFFKERYTRVSGATSMIKRQIELWIKAEVLA